MGASPGRIPQPWGEKPEGVYAQYRIALRPVWSGIPDFFEKGHWTKWKSDGEKKREVFSNRRNGTEEKSYTFVLVELSL